MKLVVISTRCLKTTEIRTQKDASKISLASEQIHFKIQPGTMLIIPGYLPHQYVVDAGLEDFRFIHWNIKAVETSISKEKSIK